MDAMQETCEEVLEKAETKGMDKYVAAAMAWEESKFTATAVSKEGALGALQVIPYWACPNRSRVGCDLVAAGVAAYQNWLKTYPAPNEALCHYNSGTVCNSASRAYATRVVRRAKKLKKAEVVCEETCGYNCGC
jgi:hypothetical protein